ncbi:UNVERIFIED_CONTAM: hypothetical protein FKN15_047853 [Acipenser sinensis]
MKEKNTKKSEGELDWSAEVVSLDSLPPQPACSEGENRSGEPGSGSGDRGAAGVEFCAAGAADSDPGRNLGQWHLSVLRERSTALGLPGADETPSPPDSQAEAAEVDRENDSEQEMDMNEAEAGESSDSCCSLKFLTDRSPKRKLYSVEQINDYLDLTKGRRGVDVKTFFPDLKLFLYCADIVVRRATLKEIDQPKRYSLKN